MLLAISFALLSFAAGSVTTVIGTADAVPVPTEGDERRTIEIRVYTLKAGARDRFHETVRREALPMLRRAGIEVVAYGPSAHDDFSYYLVRGFQDLADRLRAEDAFYGSPDWQHGPRAAIMSAIEHYSTMVVQVSAETIRGLRESLTDPNDVAVLASAAGRASDTAALLALNDAYLRAAENADVNRFREILAEDFLASLANGSHLTREAFLTLVSPPSTISDLRAHDVDVRLMGDFAILHARTTFTTKDGHRGASRYTDVWARRSGRWLCIAAQVTRYDLPSDRRD